MPLVLLQDAEQQMESWLLLDRSHLNVTDTYTTHPVLGEVWHDHVLSVLISGPHDPADGVEWYGHAMHERQWKKHNNKKVCIA